MVYIVFMLIKLFSDHLCPVDGGKAMVAKIKACPEFFNCLINSGTTPAWKHLLTIYFVSLINSSVSIILAVDYGFTRDLETNLNITRTS